MLLLDVVVFVNFPIICMLAKFQRASSFKWAPRHQVGTRANAYLMCAHVELPQIYLNVDDNGGLLKFG